VRPVWGDDLVSVVSRGEGRGKKRRGQRTASGALLNGVVRHGV